LRSSTTAITEATAIVRARAFVRNCGIDAVPVDLDKMLGAANAELRVSKRLASGQAGKTMFAQGRHVIIVNGNDTAERQRFTVLHEIAHIVLDLPSNHGDSLTSDALYSYSRRPPEEVICDTFASECLIPHEFLLRDLAEGTAEFEFVETLADRYQASLPCTASRLAVNAPFACAYVLSQDGYVRFATYSSSLRATHFRVAAGIALPKNSVTLRCLEGSLDRGSDVVPGYLWTSTDPFADVDLREEACILRTWKQGLTLISLDGGEAVDEVVRAGRQHNDEEDEPLLRELDGNLPWPSGKRRR
jgi:Zn-dependent peptidase ImmA (M78 family)